MWWLTIVCSPSRYLKHISSLVKANGVQSFIESLPLIRAEMSEVRYLGPKIAWEFEIREKLRIRLLVRLLQPPLYLLALILTLYHISIAESTYRCAEE